MFEQDMIGAIKIKDGLFIGDELASQVIKIFPCLETAISVKFFHNLERIHLFDFINYSFIFMILDIFY